MDILPSRPQPQRRRGRTRARAARRAGGLTRLPDGRHDHRDRAESGRRRPFVRQRAADLGRDVDTQTGDAEAFPFEDGAFETVASALSLGTIPDPARAVGEMKRVLVPGGRLLLLDHIGGSRRVMRRMVAEALE